MRKLIALAFLLVSINTFSQQDGYNIEIKLDGLSDTVCYLVSYYGGKFQVIDTSEVIDHSLHFNKKSSLEGGIYLLAGEKMNKYFELIIGADQEFKITASKNDLIPSLQSIGSDENKYFFEYLKFNNAEFKKIQSYQNQLKNSKEISETKRLKENIKDINQKITDYKSVYISKHPKSLLSKVFTGMQEPAVDETLPMQDAYLSYKKQYWNKIDLIDGRMLRTPILHNRFINYFDKLVVQHPDSLIQEIDIFLNQPMAEEIKNHFIWNLTLKYEYPEIMGMDKVFVHMVRNYIHTKKLSGLSETVIKNIEDRAEKIGRVLIGEAAPELVMMNNQDKVQSLYDVESKYTLVIFWDQECQVCQQELKRLKELKNQTHLGITIFAVGTDSKIEDWKKYIIEQKLDWVNVNGTQSFTDDYHSLYDIYSTPTVYLLDENKKIIAKRLSVSQIKDFISNYQNSFDSKI